VKTVIPRAAVVTTVSTTTEVKSLLRTIVTLAERTGGSMMTKTKFLILLTLLTLPVMMSAQDKLFTLEDLNFGGNNYRNMQPKNMWLTWWGDQLIQTDVEECYTIDKKTGERKILFTLAQINQWIGSNDNRYVRHLMNATFPYPDQPIVSVGNRHAILLVNFKKHQIVWQDSISGQTAYDWNKV
jgi:dipeptidyl-peptidase-4